MEKENRFQCTNLLSSVCSDGFISIIETIRSNIKKIGYRNLNYRCYTLLLVVFFSVTLFGATSDPVFPVKWAVQIIPYGTDNTVSGPFIQVQHLSDKIVYDFSYGIAYQDIFHLTVVNSNPVLGIQTYLRQATLNVLFVTSVTDELGSSSLSIKKIKGWNLGAQLLTSFYSKRFNAADPVLAPRGHTVGDTYLYYPSYYVNTNYTTAMLHTGYSNLRVVWDKYKGKGKIRELYCNALFSIPPMIAYSHVTQKGTAFTGVAERSYKNLIGACVGVRWMSLSAIGGIIGCETGLRPGICHADATYGTGTDIGAIGNIYFDFKLGFSLGVKLKK